MKKLFFIFLIFCFSVSLCNAKIITGEIEYNAESAREEVFSKTPNPINFEKIRVNLIDSKRFDNLNAIYEGKRELEGRKLAHFSDGSYGVYYYDDPEYSWFYSPQGRLISFTRKENVTFPSKVIRYKPDGSISNLGLKISENESFVYSTDGKLLGHWIGNLCYDEFNNVVMKRSIN